MAEQGLTLEQKQRQRLALEQQRLLGTILEKTDAEMEEFIDNKVKENQALEKKSDENDDGDGGYDDDVESQDLPRATDDDSSSDSENDREGTEDTEPNREEYEPPMLDSGNDDSDGTSGDDATDAWYRLMANNRSRDDEYYAPTAVTEKTLQEFLSDQLGEMELGETQLVIANAIVGNLDDNGYLRRTCSEIADDVTFNDGYTVDAQQVEKELEVVQALDPPGIAARNLQECILLQLRRKPSSEDVDIAIAMTEKYFDEMANMKFDFIARKLDISTERLKDIFRHQIRRGLNPFPGNAYASSTFVRNSQQVTPDFDVEVDYETGQITVTLRNNIPELQISESYSAMNERYKHATHLTPSEAKEKKAIVDAYQRANMFIEVLKQRQETLFKTMSAIVHCQRDYFLSGDERDLKPLGQQQIAEMIGKDVTVVSRAVNNKYVQTSSGVKSLKSFFSEDINGASRHKVYDDLKKLIEKEDKAHPLSDDALCSALKKMGYKLERRTVAKYRDILEIPSSTARRKMAK